MYDDGEGVWHLETDIPALVDDLRVASGEVQRADCDGNINADIPAMVLTDLAALTLEQWERRTQACRSACRTSQRASPRPRQG